MSDSRVGGDEFRYQDEQRSDRIEPLSIAMVLILAGVAMLFAGLSAAMLYNKFGSGLTMQFPPLVFFATVVILLAATIFMRRGKTSYISGRPGNTIKSLFWCLLFTIIFGIVQVYGWLEFFSAENSIKGNNGRGFTFALSALHLVHVVAGIPFLVAFILKLRKALNRNFPMPPRKHINALSLYWDFLDILWIALVALLVAIALF